MNRLRELRDKFGLSRETLADEIGISVQSIRRYEGGITKEPREMPLGIATKICRAYKVSLDWLAGEDVEMYRDNVTDICESVCDGLTDDGKKELLNYATYIKNKEGK